MPHAIPYFLVIENPIAFLFHDDQAKLVPHYHGIVWAKYQVDETDQIITINIVWFQFGHVHCFHGSLAGGLLEPFNCQLSTIILEASLHYCLGSDLEYACQYFLPLAVIRCHLVLTLSRRIQDFEQALGLVIIRTLAPEK